VRALRSRYLLIVVVGFIVLVFAYSTIYVSLDYDNCVYYYLAKRIAEGAVPYTDFTLFKTPLYPYLLALVFLVAGPGFPQILMTNVAIGVLTLVGLYRLGKALHTPATGVLAALVYAAAYFSVYLHAIGKTEPLFNLLLVYALLALVTPPPTGRRLHGLASPLLLALAFFTLPRASLPALGGIVLTLLTTAPRRHALRYLGLFTLFAAALSAPFLLLAPTEFLYNVFLFNALRGFQSTPGVAASIQWLLERGSLTLFAFGTLGLLLAALHAWHRLPTPLRPLAPRLHPQHATLLVSLFLLFWAILALPQFAYPYMIYPVWPLLATGAALLITPLIRRVLSLPRLGAWKPGRLPLAAVILIVVVAGVIAVDVSWTVREVEGNIAFWRMRMADMDAIVHLIEGQTGPTDAVLSFTPSLSTKISRPSVLPQNPAGWNPDLINYFPFRTFVLLMANATQPLTLDNFLTVRSTLRDVQTKIQGVEFAALLSDATILVLEEDYLATQIPEYDQTVGQIIRDRCEVLARWDWISVYVVTQ
jgi:4-amino-4-deoxy-L-arabinose transferase-like glycosyltransferase